MDNDTTRSESPLSEVSSTLSAPTDFLDSPSPSPDRMNDHDNDSDDDADMTGTGTPSTVAVGARPTKRRRTDNYEASTPKTPTIPPSPGGSISSDSSGSVPNSPSFASLGPTHPLSTAYAAFQANPSDPDASDYIQVTTCLWENCPTPNQGNMDNLVAHINEQHIVPRNKKFFCDWVGCARRSNAHLSAYALKAHMRSHTKEKPFMCSVPECDRSFTRSDALAKHMRTVHETEALRPSDPVPKSQTSKEVKPKLKLTFKKDIELPALPTIGSASQEGISVRLASLDMEENTVEELRRAVDVDAVPMRLPVSEGYYPLDVWSGMEEYERELPPSQWFRLLRRQVLWAEEERRMLEEELDAVRVRVDDLDGKLVNREGGEDVGDLIRNEEWAVVESLLDRIGSASLACQPDGNGHVDGTVFEKVQGLERFKVAT